LEKHVERPVEEPVQKQDTKRKDNAAPSEQKEPSPLLGQEEDQARGIPESLVQTWEKILALLDEQCKSLIPVLEKASLNKVGKDFIEITVGGNSFEITVGGNSFYATRLRDEKCMAQIQDICSRVFGRKMAIRIVERQDKNGAQGRPSEETDKARQLRKEALGHPTVTDALEVFEGTVVDVKIL
jgi:hypothetical protein